MEKGGELKENRVNLEKSVALYCNSLKH